MTMTTSRSRVLRGADAADAVVIASTAPAATPSDTDPVADRPRPEVHESAPPVTYSQDEVLALCDEARRSGAADAAAELEPALHRIAAGLEELNERGAEALSIALRADTERVVDTALDVARWVLGRELNDEVEVLALADRALTENGAPFATRIKVHADLVDALAAIAPSGVDVVADSTLEVGEFTTQTEGPDVSFRYTAALGRARSTLLDGGDVA